MRTTGYYERIADEWRQRAGELASWSMANLVNRTDVWGRYVRRKGEQGQSQAITAPFREERGKVFLEESSLEKHFKSRPRSGVLGLHSTSPDLTSRWLAVDIDRHDEHDLSVTAEGNFTAAQAWWKRLQDDGFDALLLDSNGIGGFHILVVFSEPMSTGAVHEFGRRLVNDYEMLGLDASPEVFPGKSQWGHYGNWLRLPGRHHSRSHFTRVWNDEPWADEKWLAGHDAIDRILGVRPATPELAAKYGVVRARRTVCLDFDGVIHSYRSGWCGEDVIPDPPVHGTREAIDRLRKRYRVVVHSTRCRTTKGRKAVEAWLKKHRIEVDEVCTHKPPAIVYVDDRAVRFEGDWNETISTINHFRR